MTLARLSAGLAGAGSLAMLLSAFAFQFLGGLSPCPMCLWQRWPHALAALLGLLVVVGMPVRPIALAGALTMLASIALAIFHSGVERHWWQGLSTCSSAPVDGLSPDQLFDQIMAAPLVRCDEIAWTLFGLSMPNWNVLCSLGLALLWALALNAARRH